MSISIKKHVSSALTTLLIAALTLGLVGCGNTSKAGNSAGTSQATNNSSVTSQEALDSTGTSQETLTATDDIISIGEGEHSFTFQIVDADGNESFYNVSTDEETVGAALLSLGLIEGDSGDYGLYVKVVDGISADYDKDGVYWAFYENGQYASAGVDSTPVTSGSTYSFKIEK